MRTLIVILLSVIFSLNAAFAAVAGVCDAIDHLPQGGSEQHFHVDQHSHSVSETMADERANGDTDKDKDRKFNRHPGSISAPVTHRQLENCPQSLIAPCNNRCPTLPEARNTPSVGRIAGLGQERSRRAAFAAVRYHAIR